MAVAHLFSGTPVTSIVTAPQKQVPVCVSAMASPLLFPTRKNWLQWLADVRRNDERWKRQGVIFR